MEPANANDTRAGGGVIRPRSASGASVLIVDDHPAVRSGLKGLIAAEPGLDPIAVVGSADAAIAAYERLRPALAVVDYPLGRRDGLSLCLALKSYPRPPRILIFSAFADEHLTIASLIAGADGILSKTVLGHELCEALWTLVRGRRVRPPVGRDALEAVAMSLGAQDVPVLDMLANGVEPRDIATALDTTMQSLTARRSAMLKQLLRRSSVAGLPDRSVAPAP